MLSIENFLNIYAKVWMAKTTISFGITKNYNFNFLGTFIFKSRNLLQFAMDQLQCVGLFIKCKW